MSEAVAHRIRSFLLKTIATAGASIAEENSSDDRSSRDTKGMLEWIFCVFLHMHWKLLEPIRPDTDNETKQTESDGRQYQKRNHHPWMSNFQGHEKCCGSKNDKPDNDRLGRSGSHITQSDLDEGYRRGQDLVNRASKARKVYSKRGIGNALGQK